MKPFVKWVDGSPRLAQLIVRGVFWAFIVLPLFAVFDLLRILAICMHDVGEWLCSIGLDGLPGETWCREWWALRKRI